ncbi:MAG: AAA family ATPase [Nanoarchaeota archaeon]|nr:AAA family ATPase [Nanoarchaeota archaeon]
MRIYIGGVGGVGKTAISKEFIKNHKEFKHLPGSEIMMTACEVNSRKELSELDLEYKLEIENTKYVEVVKEHPFLIVDGHCRLTKAQADCFDIFVYMVANAETIKQRRKEKGRRNCSGIEADIKEYNKRVENLKTQHDIKIHKLKNEGITEYAVKSLENLIKGYTES